MFGTKCFLSIGVLESLFVDREIFNTVQSWFKEKIEKNFKNAICRKSKKWHLFKKNILGQNIELNHHS